MNEKKRMTMLRDKELLRDYRRKLREAYASKEPVNRRALVREVLRESKPHYYVCFDHAYNVMTRINSTSRVTKRTRLKQQMWFEIHDKVREIMEKHPRIAMHNALSLVLAGERASRYFISESYAYKYLYKVCHANRSNILSN